jgi:hypothetical protein
VDVTAISAAYNAIKGGKELLTGYLDAKVEKGTEEKIRDVLAKLGQAQDALFEMREELFRLQADNESLRKKQNDADSWAARLAEYELRQTAGGAIVYVFRGEPLHYVCPSCVNKKEVHLLQDNRTVSGKFRCTGCANEYPINPRKDASRLSYSDDGV